MCHRLSQVCIQVLVAFGALMSVPAHAGPASHLQDFHGPLTAVQAGAAVEHGYSGLLQSIPAIRWTTPESIEAMWKDVKATKHPGRQLRMLAELGVYQSACPGLVDLRRAFRHRHPEASPRVAFRDDHRGRSWLQPHVAAVIETALETLGRTYRNPRTSPLVVFGDAAQPGCGQLEYGALIEMVSDSAESLAATELLNRAVLRNGVPIATLEERDPSGHTTLTETALVGHAFDASGRLTLRTQTRRFQRAPRSSSVRELYPTERVEAVFSSGRLSQTRVLSWDSKRQTHVTRWHATFGGTHWQLVTVSRRPLGTDRPLMEQRGNLIEVRLSRRIRLKPGTFKDETRWVNAGGSKESWAVGWRRWDLVHEAGHQSHVAGRDLDVAYLTTDDLQVFTHAPDKLDVARTWQWFNSVDRAANYHGTRLERILVGPRIHRILRQTLAPEALSSRLFTKTVRASRGHDGHHHLRFSSGLSHDAPLTERLLRPLSLIYAELFQNR